MPVTYNLIASNTLSSSAASVTFSAIPGTYTDLVLRLALRSDTSGVTADSFRIRFNSDNGSVYSGTNVYVNNAASVLSNRESNVTSVGANGFVIIPGPSATSSTFSNTEVYIPSYTVSQNKPISVVSASENNATTPYSPWFNAFLWRNTAAITSIEVTRNFGIDNLVSGSSVFLYGIKNS